MEEEGGACSACEDLGRAASNKRTARPEEEARDARATQYEYARHIPNHIPFDAGEVREGS